MDTDDAVSRTSAQLQEAWAVAALLEDEMLAARVRRLTHLLDAVRDLAPSPQVPAQRSTSA